LAAGLNPDPLGERTALAVFGRKNRMGKRGIGEKDGRKREKGKGKEKEEFGEKK